MTNGYNENRPFQPKSKLGLGLKMVNLVPENERNKELSGGKLTPDSSVTGSGGPKPPGTVEDDKLMKKSFN